ncbi:uncharacterized protein LOC143274276 isoform X2 [Peromyscus maniculatus bairdii]|uniref:uncharacterized protein LOC143274276 isoform X2 n=1 Tax=Peromyscus maniculatus bairdii TaxID=230844 RepID=UPI003FCEF452
MCAFQHQDLNKRHVVFLPRDPDCKNTSHSGTKTSRTAELKVTGTGSKSFPSGPLEILIFSLPSLTVFDGAPKTVCFGEKAPTVLFLLVPLAGEKIRTNYQEKL